MHVKDSIDPWLQDMAAFSQWVWKNKRNWTNVIKSFQYANLLHHLVHVRVFLLLDYLASNLLGRFECSI